MAACGVVGVVGKEGLVTEFEVVRKERGLAPIRTPGFCGWSAAALWHLTTTAAFVFLLSFGCTFAVPR